MKKTLLTTALVATILTVNPLIVSSEENETLATNEFMKFAPFMEYKFPTLMEFKMPTLYDKNGKELKEPPKPGETVYDKDGNKIQPPFCGAQKPPKEPNLNLTDAQKSQMDVIRKASINKIKPIRKEILNSYYQIWEIKENDSLTQEQKYAQTQPIVENIKTLEKQADAIRKADMEQFEKLLTTKQKSELEKFKKNNAQDKRVPPPMPIYP
jgi:Spy/CpxP family protein refolding chaperone